MELTLEFGGLPSVKRSHTVNKIGICTMKVICKNLQRRTEELDLKPDLKKKWEGDSRQREQYVQRP